LKKSTKKAVKKKSSDKRIAKNNTKRSSHVARVDLIADLHAEGSSATLGGEADLDQYAILFLDRLAGFDDIAHLERAAKRTFSEPCGPEPDLESIAKRFVTRVLGRTWRLGELINSCPRPSGGYKLRQPDDPPCSTFRVVKGRGPEPRIRLTCGGQPSPTGNPSAPRLDRNLWLRFAVTVSVKRRV
jgi:hypothetical protein